MDEVVGSVKRVTDIIGEIAAASEEQSAGIEQVNLAIIQMDQVTQQNAALVEEAAAAAESMQDQAHELAAVVGIFQTGDAAPRHRQQRATVASRARARPASSVKAVTVRPAPARVASKHPRQAGQPGRGRHRRRRLGNLLIVDRMRQRSTLPPLWLPPLLLLHKPQAIKKPRHSAVFLYPEADAALTPASLPATRGSPLRRCG